MFDLRDATKDQAENRVNGVIMAPPVHAHAERGLPVGILLNYAVDPDGETFVRADQDRACNDTMGCVAEAATYGRERYPAIPRPRGSLETAPPTAPSAA